jgi:Putative prokaryotic signal transducing protein
MAEKSQDPEEYVTVAEFMEPVFAQMAKGALESAGIESFLEGEHANSLIGAAFWAQLQVHRQDEETAREILDSADASEDASAAELSASDTSTSEK